MTSTFLKMAKTLRPIVFCGPSGSGKSNIKAVVSSIMNFKS